MKYKIAQLTNWISGKGKLLLLLLFILMVIATALSLFLAIYVDRAGIGGIGITGNMDPARREMRIQMAEFARERRMQQMPFDLWVLGHEMSQSFPFFEQAILAGIDVEALYNEAMEELAVASRYGFGVNFLRDFINEHLIYHFDGLGSLHLISEPQLQSGGPAPVIIDEDPYGGFEITGGIAITIPWLEQPYFFGYHDWRFDVDFAHVETLTDNITTDFLSENIAFAHINSFLARGYEDVTRRPFWHFDFDAEYARMLDFYEEIADAEHLIIDIRGIGSGFGDYFLPIILSPNMPNEMSFVFYAFHTGGSFAQSVSSAYREWYNLGDVYPATAFLPSLPAASASDFENLAYGFVIEHSFEPATAFSGQIWLITDSPNFTGPNHMYLEMASQAGFRIVYQENPNATPRDGWETSLVRLPYSGLSLRYNPLYFTDSEGRSFEAFPAQPHYRLTDAEDPIEFIKSQI